MRGQLRAGTTDDTRKAGEAAAKARAAMVRMRFMVVLPVRT